MQNAFELCMYGDIRCVDAAAMGIRKLAHLFPSYRFDSIPDSDTPS